MEPTSAFSSYPSPDHAATPRPPLCSDRRDTVLALVLLVLTIVAANFSLFGGFHLGFVLAYAALTLCGGIYLRGKTGRPTGYTVFCLAASWAALGIFVWHNDGVIRFAAFMGMMVLTSLVLVDVTGQATHNTDDPAILQDVLDILIVRPVSHLNRTLPALFRVQRGETVEKRRCGSVLLGLACALPVLFIVVPLLSSADAAFEGLLDVAMPNNIEEILDSLVVGAVLFLLLFGRWFSLRYDLTQEKTARPVTRRRVDSLPINVFLGTVSVVYVLYLVSQLAYLVRAFSGILPEDYTVAQYARRGFFEMCAVCGVNSILVAICLWLCRKQEGKTPLSTRLFTLFLLLFSVGLVGTALAKMGLYIGSFGMTRLRILTSVFMLMLGGSLLFCGVRLFVPRFSALKAIVVTVALLGLTVGYADVDTVITRYNVTAYQSGQLEEIDVRTLANLSDGSTPYLLELLKDKNTPKAVQSHTATVLWERMDDFGRFTAKGAFKVEKALDFRHYTVDTSRSRQMLIDNADLIYKYAK